MLSQRPAWDGKGEAPAAPKISDDILSGREERCERHLINGKEMYHTRYYLYCWGLFSIVFLFELQDYYKRPRNSRTLCYLYEIKLKPY